MFFQGKNMLVIGTTSEVSFLESVGVCDAFSVTYHVPTLKTEDAKTVKVVLILICLYAVFFFPVHTLYCEQVVAYLSFTSINTKYFLLLY